MDHVVDVLYAAKHRSFNDVGELQVFVETQAHCLLDGVVARGVLLRQHNSKTFSMYTEARELPSALHQFCGEFFQRLANSEQLSKEATIDLAAWGGISRQSHGSFLRGWLHQSCARIERVCVHAAKFGLTHPYESHPLLRGGASPFSLTGSS